MIKEGQTIILFSTLMLLAIYYFITRWTKNEADKGNLPEIRSIPALEEIDQALNRSYEMGSVAFWHPGSFARLSDYSSIACNASLEVLRYVARHVAALGGSIVAGMKWAEVYPVAVNIIREAYTMEEIPDQFDEDKQMLYFSDDWITTMGGTMDYLMQEKPQALILIGSYGTDGVFYPETGLRYGAMIISGTDQMMYVPAMFICSDYTLIGEEIFAAGAYLSKDPEQIANIIQTDVFRIIFLIVMLFSEVLINFGVDLTKILGG